MIFKLLIILFILMLIIGEERGFKAFGTLLFNGMTLIISVFLISDGFGPYIVCLIASVLITIFTLIFQNGKNIKSLAAVVSVIIVMILLSIFIVLIVKNSHMGGYSEVDRISEEAMYLSVDLDISMEDLMVCVVLMGLLGAIMDTAIAITTAVYEVHRNNTKLGENQLMLSGAKVGRDILGTTANTLFFAGMGETIMLFIWLIRMKNYSFSEIINSKAFFQEMGVIVISNIGCMVIIPVAIGMITLFIRKNREDIYEDNTFI